MHTKNYVKRSPATPTHPPTIVLLLPLPSAAIPCSPPPYDLRSPPFLDNYINQPQQQRTSIHNNSPAKCRKTRFSKSRLSTSGSFSASSQSDSRPLLPRPFRRASRGTRRVRVPAGPRGLDRGRGCGRGVLAWWWRCDPWCARLWYSGGRTRARRFLLRERSESRRGLERECSPNLA